MISLRCFSLQPCGSRCSAWCHQFHNATDRIRPVFGFRVFVQPNLAQFPARISIRSNSKALVLAAISQNIPRYRPSGGGELQPISSNGIPRSNQQPQLPQNGVDYSTNALLVRLTSKNSVVESEGTVVILGDVDQGSEVVAGGDVIVWGKLEGCAVAGKNGDRNSVIVAQQMMPRQLTISNVTAIAPDQYTSPVGYAEVAFINEDSSSIDLKPAKLSKPPDGALPANPLATSATAAAAWLTGLYILLLGVALMYKPMQVFGVLFDASAVPAGWIRVGGVLAALFGCYYLGAAYGEQYRLGLGGFYMSSVLGRLFLVVCFSAFVMMGELPSTALLLAGLNLLSAMGMVRALLRAA